MEIESNYRCYQLDIPLALQYNHNKADIQMLLHFYVFNQGLAQGNFISYELLINQMALLHYSITNSGRQQSCPCWCVMVLRSCKNPHWGQWIFNWRKKKNFHKVIFMWSLCKWSVHFIWSVNCILFSCGFCFCPPFSYISNVITIVKLYFHHQNIAVYYN